MAEESDDSVNSSKEKVRVCDYCETLIRKGQKCSKCTFCKTTSIHAKCLDIYTKTTEADRKDWTCKTCDTMASSSGWSSEEPTIIIDSPQKDEDKIAKQVNTMLKVENDLLKKLITELETVNKLQKEKIMFLEKSLDVRGKPSTENISSYAEMTLHTYSSVLKNPSKNVLLIKPTDTKQTADVTCKQIKNAVDPIALSVEINNVIPRVGYAICMIDLYMGMYYNTIIGWAVYYLLASFQSTLPWTSCENYWNTKYCKPVRQQHYPNATSPAREFFEREVLEQYKSDGLDRMGPIKPALALCVFAVFVLVYFSLWKGVKSTGKAVWITALAPYFVLIILLVRGVTLPGAGEGILYYLTPQWHKLYNSKVWIDAASQIFFSLGPGFGTLLALASYNKFNNNCYRDALLTSTINCLTSFLAGFVIFSVLGYMAKEQNKSIEEVGLEGPGLVFIVYPEAIATMTGSVFWSIIFFLMLITLGLDSTFGGLEAMITALCDEYPKVLGRHREIFVGFLLLGIYICALPTTTYVSIF
ncbi:sodium/chloride dependent transporter [Holotrichia oblita]|uniref:Sodium/chloride dependent transporter n=1 Tax=Holotrichia oblita TaxID=644536 RepID=A0ACB9TWR8_HOLOL|nr:sodium/chloride dependent transporter [Holotrichia oblita]